MKAEEIKNELVKRGWEELPFKNIGNSITKHIKRNIYAGVSSLGTPNEIITVFEINRTNPKIIDDLIIVHNYDYDGYLTLERIEALVFGLTGTKI